MAGQGRGGVVPAINGGVIAATTWIEAEALTVQQCLVLALIHAVLARLIVRRQLWLGDNVADVLRERRDDLHPIWRTRLRLWLDQFDVS